MLKLDNSAGHNLSPVPKFNANARVKSVLFIHRPKSQIFLKGLFSLISISLDT